MSLQEWAQALLPALSALAGTLGAFGVIKARLAAVEREAERAHARIDSILQARSR